MAYQAAVITISDKGARGERMDTSGPALQAFLKEQGMETAYTCIIPDDRERIEQELIRCADELGTVLILTTGGTGFSLRDVTPEATKAVLERETPGIPEAMRAESMKITPRGCLSRGTAGIRGGSLIINLPGSKKAAIENIEAVWEGISHGLDMLASAGSADCGEEAGRKDCAAAGGSDSACPAADGGASACQEAEKAPSLDAWIAEAKADPDSPDCGMYLFHNGVVRRTARAQVRQGQESGEVTGMLFSYDRKKAEQAAEEARRLPGVFHVRVWMNQGKLSPGDDIMLVLIGGDTRPHVIAALETLVGKLKKECVEERELF